MQKIKKPVSILLALMMVVSLFAVVPMTAGAATASYVKVTSEPDDWSGDYLIVYEDEEGSKAFNGAGSLLNNSGNYIDVTISNGEIASNDSTNAAKVTIAQIDNGYSIATAGGTYIGGQSGANKVITSGDAIPNTISLDDEDYAVIVSNGTYFRYNTGWPGFRYYKTLQQQPVQLYKLTAAEPEPATQSWTSGDCTVTYDPATTTMTVTGNGAMANYTDEDDDDPVVAPWADVKNSVTSVVISDGVTGIGDYAFYNFSNLTSLSIADTVTAIGAYAFYNISNITITIPASVTSIGDSAFYPYSTGGVSVTFVRPTSQSTLTVGNGAFYYTARLAYSGDGKYTLFNGDSEMELTGANDHEGNKLNGKTLTWKLPTYAVTDASVNGTVTASVGGTDVTEAEADDTVLLTVAPAAGYQFKSITATCAKNGVEDFSDLVALMGDAVADGCDGVFDGYTFKVEDGEFVIYNGSTLFAELSELDVSYFQVGDETYAESGDEGWYFTLSDNKITGFYWENSLTGDYFFTNEFESTGTLPLAELALTTVTEGSQYSFTMPKNPVTVAAEFEAIPTYTVTWKNDDGTVIDTTEVEEGTVPTHADATKANDTFYSYTFAGWNDGENTYAPSELPAVTGDDTYTATFTAVPFSEVTVTTKADFETAIANNSVDTIIIGADIASGYAGSGNIVSYRKNVDRTLTIKCVGSEKYSLKGYAFRVGSNTSKAASLSFENVIIDGNCPNAISANGYDFFMTVVGANSSLNFKDGAVVCNFYHKSTQSVIEAGRGSNASGNNIQGSGLKGTINVYDGAEFYNLGAQFGIFRLNGNAVMNMYGGTVRNCTTYDKEAIVAYIANGAAFNMSGGEIKNCTGTSSSNNSVVYLGMWGTSTFTMTGGTITSNTAKHSAFLGTTGSSKITIGGDAKISGGSGSSNIYLANGRTITMHDTHLTEEADIWLYTATNPSNTADVKIATNAVKDDIAYIHSDNTVNAGVVYCDGETDWVYLNGVMTKLNNGAAHHTHTANTIWLSTAANDSNIELNTTQAVTWNNWDGTTIKTDRVAEGNTPSYDGETPTHAADAQYTYTFTGWTDGNGTFYAKDAELPAVTGDVTYTAVFDSTVNEYTITWKNDDGTVIDTTTVAYGEVPTHADATKAPDKYYTYTFAGWTPEITAVIGDAEYTAQFTPVAKTFMVFVKRPTGSTINVYDLTGETTVAQLKAIIAEKENIPVTEQNLIFAGTQLEDEKTLAEYNIEKESTLHLVLNTYTVTWLNYDNSELGTTTVQYGSTPTYDGTTPEKAEDENYTYTFAGWSPEITAVTGDETYTATYTATAKPKDLFPQHSITLGGNIGVNFYIDSAAADFANASTAVVKFTWDGGGEDRTKEVDLTKLTPDADGYYKATVDVVAAQMAHKIHAEVYLNGEKLEQTDDYSVQDYAETVFANPEKYDSDKPDELKALAKALLNYGAMAQTVFADSLTEAVDLPTGVVGVTDFSGVTADDIAAAIKGSASDLNTAAAAFDAEFYTSSLIYLSRNTLRLYFTPASKTVGALNGLDFSGNLSEYYYYVDVENIAAAELDNQQTFSVNGTEFTFSALDYAKAVVNSNNMSDTQKDLAKSLYLYNQAANAYFDPTV